MKINKSYLRKTGKVPRDANDIKQQNRSESNENGGQAMKE